MACSQSQIPISLEGFARLTSGLTRLEERLNRVREEYIRLNLNNNKTSSSILPGSAIPSCMSWIVTMWRFGRDSLTEYSGERFHITWEEGLKVFRIYSKGLKKKIKIRKKTPIPPTLMHQKIQQTMFHLQLRIQK